MNAADMIVFMRDALNEATASFWSDLELLKRLNFSQSKVQKIVAQAPDDWLTKRATVTPVSSVITLPADCSKPIYLEEVSSGNPIPWLVGGVGYRSVSRGKADGLDVGMAEAYPLAGTIEINQDSFSNSCYLWYQRRVPDMHYGYADTGSGASALVLDKSVVAASNDAGTGRAIRFVDDYYNGVYVEVIDGTSGLVDIRSEISDFTASSATAVITGTPAANDIYGTISILPEEVHRLMLLDAVIASLIKPSAKLDKETLNYYRAEYSEEKKMVDEWIENRIIASRGIAVGDPY